MTTEQTWTRETQATVTSEGSATEDERTTAERWARAYEGEAQWAERTPAEVAARVAAMLPLVREARASDRDVERLTRQVEILAARSAAAEARLLTSATPAPLTEAEARLAAVLDSVWLPLLAPALNEEQAARLRSDILAASRGDIPADVRPSGCSDGCGAAKDAHCWNTSSWTLAAKEDLVAALADPATAEGAAALLDIGAYQGGKLDIDERARQTEPALTTAEQDLVVAAIPLQTGLTRDGQRLAADGIRQALERPPLTEADVTEIARAALSAWGASNFRTLASCLGSAIMSFEAREDRSGRGDIQADVDTKGGA